MELLVSGTTIVTIVVACVMALYWLNIFIILYHLIRFGVGTRPKQSAFIFFAGSFVLFLFLMLSTLPIIYYN